MGIPSEKGEVQGQSSAKIAGACKDSTVIRSETQCRWCMQPKY